ncbi:RNA polymerase sigma factor [Kibdelosporangium aridum]|uniref:RNA polymerase sigma factor n=1 Tax=Kibdelosporangium aridum TaxID=2030 RepID=UPI000A00FB57|nr:sigma-70 family RNA polymerase sigma factor [Kibdelosporangium aridum]
MDQPDEQGWRELVAAHGPKVWAVARAYKLSDADADDVFQTTWLNLAEHLKDIRDSGRVSAWLATAAKRECLRVLSVRRPLPVRWQPELVQDGVEHVILREERDRQLWRAFRTLPDRCQRLLRLYVYAPEFSYAQLADAIGIRADSIGQTKGRCLRELKGRLDKSLFDQVDPMPDVIAVPSRTGPRFTTLSQGETRSADASLRFGDHERSVQVEIGALLTGVVTPRGDVQVWWPNGMVSVDVDCHGLFKADVPSGPVRLAVDGVVTDWFVR